MGLAGFLGCALIAGGPSLAIFCTVLWRKSFLALLVLACAFAWLVGLLLISALFRGFDPLEAHTTVLLAALVVGVAVQEAMRIGAWIMHRKLVGVLNRLAAGMEDAAPLAPGDEHLLALAQGWAHGTTHLFFFYFSWLPLYAGEATLYTDACPAMSYFVAGALLSLAFALLHTFSMVVAFDGLSKGRQKQVAAAPVAHLVAALLTLANMRRGGCLATIPVLLVMGLGSVAAAGWVVWESRGSSPTAQGHMPVSTVDEDS